MANFSPNAITVMERRICAKDEDGNPIETPDEVFDRVAHEVAKGTSDPKAYEPVFRTMLHNLDFIPNSPALVNAGRELGQLSACFVLPVEDSMEGIFDAVKWTAMIHKSGGGTGFSFSRLRPKGATVRSTSGVASGPVSFMDIFDVATEKVKQGGTRRGANMGILSIDHPDIWEFIHMKAGRDRLQNFNISIGMTDAFMISLHTQPDEPWKDSGHTVTEIWRALIHNAWLTGDPGLVFLDKINHSKANPVPSLGPIESTNPCGEQPLYPFDSCNLGSINLANAVVDEATSPQIDWTWLRSTVTHAVRFLDAVITINKYPIEQIAERTHEIRRIGLGVMGFADMLLKLGISYHSAAALKRAEEVMSFIQDIADGESQVIAANSSPFPLFSQSIYQNGASTIPLRNATRTTIAPTGTISIIANCSSGIEPLFALAFERSHYLDRTDATKRHTMFEVNPVFEAYARKHDFYSEELIAYLASGGSIMNREDVPLAARQLFKTAHDIPPEFHVRMQAAFQAYTDNAVSKTINLPHDATEADVDQAYRLAYQLDCLGITVYRDGSHENQVLSHTVTLNGSTQPDDYPAVYNSIVHDVTMPAVSEGTYRTIAVVDDHSEPAMLSPIRSHWRHAMPAERNSKIHKMEIDGFEFYLITGFYDDGTLGEVFITGNKTGATISGLLDITGMLISFCLQHGVPVDQLFGKLKGMRFEPAGLVRHVPEVPMATSIIDLIARFILARYDGHVPDHHHEESPPTLAISHVAESVHHPFSGGICPDCGSVTIHVGGCVECLARCGYSKCE